MKHFYVLIFSFLLLSYGFSQNINMPASGSSNTASFNCVSGSLFDSGGSGGDYGNSQNAVLTVCPSVSGNALAFNVDMAAFGSGDFLCVYDGSTTSDPVLLCIDESTYIDPSILIQTSVNNTTGCVTFQFSSDASDVGSFELALSCAPPCQSVEYDITSVVPEVDTTENYVYVVEGQTIDLCAEGVYAQNNTGYTQDDATSTFTWNMGDGTFLTGACITYTYSGTGIYSPSLTVTDVNGCQSLVFGGLEIDNIPGNNGESLKVVVLPIPDFNLSVSPSPVCFGDTVSISAVVDGDVQGNSIIGDTLFTVAAATTVDTLFLPDDANGIKGDGISTPSLYPLPVSGYLPGAVLTDVNDIQSICLDIEHSWVGDIDVMLVCPNGQQMFLIDMNQTLGEYFFGNPIDGSPFHDVDTYCWSPDATLPAISDASVFSTIQIPPGTYQANDSWNSLLGCPLNGDWEVQIIDDWPGDTGYTTAANIVFAPNLLADVDTLPLVYNVDGFWSPNPTIITSANQNDIEVLPDAPGIHTYTYHVLDHLGNEYTGDVNVNISAYTIPYEDVSICDGDTADIGVQFPSIIREANYGCAYTLNMFDSFLDGWWAGYIAVYVDGSLDGIYTDVDGFTSHTFYVDTGQLIELVYNPPFFNNDEISYSLTDADGNILFSDGPSPGSGLVYSTTSACNALVADPIVPSDPCTYTVEMFDSYGDGWDGSSVRVFEDGVNIGVFTITDEIGVGYFTVTPGSLLEISFDLQGFFPEDIYFIITDPLGNTIVSSPSSPGTGVYYNGVGTCVIPEFTWSPSLGLSSTTDSVVQAFPTQTTTYQVTTTFPNGCIYTDSIMVEIGGFEYTVTNDTVICLGESLQLEATGADVYAWSPNDGSLSDTTLSNPVATPTSDIIYQVELERINCAVVMETVSVDVIDLVPVSISPTDTSTCDGESVTLTATASGSNFVWITPSGNVSGTTIDVSEEGYYYYEFLAAPSTCLNRTDSIFVEVFDLPQSVINTGQSPIQFCAGESVVLEALPNIHDYQWVDGPNANVYQVGVAGTYVVNYTDFNGCSNTTSVEVEEFALPTIDFTDLRNILCCTDDSVTVLFSDYVSGAAIDSVFWDGVYAETAVTEYAEGFSELEIHDVVVVDENGCRTISLFTVETICIDAALVDVPATALQGESFDIGVDVLNPIGNATYAYSWQPEGEMNDATIQYPQYTAFSTGTVQVSALVQGSYSLNSGEELTCEEYVVTDVFVEGLPQPEVPNAFTPNGDGLNNRFIPHIDSNSDIIAFRIYNRWGELLYDYVDGDLGWDGTSAGEMQPVDDYVYYLELENSLGKKGYTGTVTLLK